MKTGILTIGNELTSGRIQDTNSRMITRALYLQGWKTAGMMSVGDDEKAIDDALSYLLARVDALIVTGGLGPTADDITTAAIAGAFGLQLYTDETVLDQIKSIFARRGLRWTENNAKQALFPEGATIIPNWTGTAAGFALQREGKLILVIPGVPGEARRMLSEGVIPLIRAAFPDSSVHVKSITCKLFGIAESAVDEAIAPCMFAEAGIGVGFYPNFPENHLVLTAREESEEAAAAKLATATARVEKILGDYIFARDEETLAGNVARLLTDKKLSLATAESCTGGLISDRITDIPGSSDFFERGIISYSNEAKIALLGVPAETIARYGAISEETVRIMAEGVRRLAGTNLGLAATGIAGPSGGSAEKPVGTVFIALAEREKTFCRRHSFRWDRRWNKIVASEAALLMLWRYLTGVLKNAE